MKKLILVFLVTVGLVYSLYATKKQDVSYGETISTENVCERWGNASMDLEKFKAATNDETVRAKMACSLLKNQKRFIGKSRPEIWEILGRHDGFYFNEMSPAYIIESAKTKDDSTWQILFRLDRNHRISGVVVHQNCCDF